MKKDMIDNFLEELKNSIYFEDIGIHKIVDNEYIKPIWKSENCITNSKWKNFHQTNKQYIQQDDYLKQLVDNKESIFIEKIKEGGSNCLKDFKIKSTCLIPIISNNKVVGFVTMPIFSKEYEYSRDEMIQSIEIINEYKEMIKEMIFSE